MLTIEIPIGEEAYDESTRMFFYPNARKIDMEHSLASVSKWESKFEKSFLSTPEKTEEEVLHYIQSMTLTPDVPRGLYDLLTEENLKSINAHIDAKMTATKFFDRETRQSARPQTITAEILYHWMITYQIPFECQYWHLNRLLALIKVCVNKNTPPKPMSHQEIANHNRELNRKRKQEWGITG